LHHFNKETDNISI